MNQVNISEYVNAEAGLVSRKIFVDHDVYLAEQEKVFARTWLLLGHVSQIPAPGDYMLTTMGEDPVIVTRTKDGAVRAFLNSCRHRGVKLCRTEKGKAARFICPYHGWTYSNDGRLIGVPHKEKAYLNELDLKKWALIEVAQLDLFGGLIFATWSKECPPLLNHLGGMVPYLDRMLNRVEGGVEVIGGIQKWEASSNWKLVTENALGDAYHVPMAHGSVVDIGFRTRPKLEGYEFAFEEGHGFGSEEGGIGAGTAMASDYGKFLVSLREEQSKTNPAARFIPIGHGGIFPNISFLDTLRIRFVRICHPRGADRIESVQFALVDKAMPEELKAQLRRDYILSFGPAGMFEVEDAELNGTIIDGSMGFIGRNQVLNYQMGVGHERDVSDVYGGDLPGRTGFYYSEIGHRHFYKRYIRMMDAP